MGLKIRTPQCEHLATGPLAVVEVLAVIEALPLIEAALTAALAMYGWVCDLILDTLTPCITPPPNPTPSTVFTYFTGSQNYFLHPG